MKKISLAFVLFLYPLLFFAQSIEFDQKLGEENARMVETQMGIYDDEEKTIYLRKVGNRLVSQLEEPLFNYQFHLVPDMAPNAFALPGGYLYVTTGLLPILESEDELACILGHEIIHSNNRHAVKEIEKSIVPKLLEVPGNLLGVIDEDLGTWFNTPIKTTNAMLLASYGRSFETEADDEGVLLAANAGYNPEGMITSLNRMMLAIEKATGLKEQKSYFNDHPYTPDRTKAIDEKITDLDWTKKDPISQNFLYQFDSVLFGNSPNQGVINGNKFLHPDLNFSIQFPNQWAIDNQPSNVGAYSPDKQAAAFVALENSDMNPKQAGQKFIDNLSNDYKSKMTEAAPYTLNGKEGYMLSFIENVESVTMYAYILWIPLDDKLFKLTGIAPIEYKTILEETAGSLGRLNKEDRSSITINLLRVVEAKKGENINTLSARVGNILDVELTGIINSKNDTDKLKKGELIKVVLSYPYFTD